MNIWEEYIKWLNNPQGYSWKDYYFLYIAKTWHRESKQRNYQRNKDIFYKNTTTKRNGVDVENELIPFNDDGEFILDENILYLTYKDKGYKAEESYSDNPVSAYVDSDLDLNITLKNGVTGTNFFIDSDGNLVNRGTDEYSIENQNLVLNDEVVLRSVPVKRERIRPFNFISMEVNGEMNLVADIPNMILDAEFKIDNNGNLTLKYG